jgi:hypothetical protein
MKIAALSQVIWAESRKGTSEGPALRIFIIFIGKPTLLNLRKMNIPRKRLKISKNEMDRLARITQSRRMS